MKTTKKWVVISESNGSQFEDGFFDNKEKAVEEAISSYKTLSDYDKKNLDDFFVGLFECEEVNGNWLLVNVEPEEVAIDFDTIKNGIGIEYNDGKFYELSDAKDFFKRETTEDFDEDDVNNFNKELKSVNSFTELVNILKSWAATFEDRGWYEVLYK